MMCPIYDGNFTAPQDRSRCWRHVVSALRVGLEQTLRTCQQARRQRTALLVQSLLSSGGRVPVPNLPHVEHVDDDRGGSCLRISGQRFLLFQKRHESDGGRERDQSSWSHS